MQRYYRLIFAGIIILAAILRFWQLGEIPHGISNDEAGFIYSAYSIWETGRDVTGKFLPLSFNIDNSFSPAIVYFLAPIVGILGPTPIYGRLFSALMGTISVVSLYGLVRLVFREKYLALLSAGLLAVSPWHIFVSRVISAEISLSFFLLGSALFVYGLKKRTLFWSLPFFFLSFHSYHPAKIFLAAFLFVFIVAFWKDLRIKKRELAIFIAIIGLFYVSFLAVLRFQNVTRQSVLTFADPSRAARFVDWERTTSVAPLWLSSIFSNKLTYFTKEFLSNYFNAFSPNLLFLHGEPSGLFNVQFRGLLYLLDLPLLLLGIWRLLHKGSRPQKIFALGSLLVSPLPSALSSQTYVMRSITMVPFLIFLISLGSVELWKRLKGSTVFRVLFGALYIFGVVSFVYQYFFRYPVYGAEASFYSSRQLAEFIGEKKREYQEIINYQTDPIYLLQYGIFVGIDPRIMQSLWKEPWPKQYENVTFVRDSLKESAPYFDPQTDIPPDTLYIAPPECHRLATPSGVITDRGEPLRTIWAIFTRNE